jgi:hypothetical protein
VGGGFSNANTDYLPQRVNGGTAYFDFDFTHHFGLEGEFRFIKDGHTQMYEKTYQIGARYYHPIGRFPKLVPYAKGMYGRGVYNFTAQGSNNQWFTVANLAYNMYALGGGVDYRLLPYLNVRGDFEYQSWLSFPPNGLAPTVFTIGAAYRFGSRR